MGSLLCVYTDTLVWSARPCGLPCVHLRGPCEISVAQIICIVYQSPYAPVPLQSIEYVSFCVLCVILYLMCPRTHVYSV